MVIAEQRAGETAGDPAAASGDRGALAVWLLTDGKPGHESQLRGIAGALMQRRPLMLTWVDVTQRPAGWLDLLRGRHPALARVAAPDLAIAAGRRTHRQLLALGRASTCMTCVLMRPSLPLWCFDAAIIPRHDNPPVNERVLVTEGALNPVTPASQNAPAEGLIMLGGPSRHFAFPIDQVCRQVDSLCARFPDLQWTATNSRRTPEGTLGALQALQLANLQLVDHAATDPGWVPRMLGHCRQAWITEDSVSMVYEALSAGITSGLIALQARRRGRLQRGLAALQQSGMLHRLDAVLAGACPTPPPHPLQEAQRAADWLLGRLRHRGTA